MASKQPSKPLGCNCTEASVPHEVNETGYNDEPARYSANPEAGFWRTVLNKLKGIKK